MEYLQLQQKLQQQQEEQQKLHDLSRGFPSEQNDEEEDSLPPFALPLINSELSSNAHTLHDDDYDDRGHGHTTSDFIDSIGGDELEFHTDNQISSSVGPYTSFKGIENEYKYKYDRQQGNQESTSFSKLMNQADNRRPSSLQSSLTIPEYNLILPPQEVTAAATTASASASTSTALSLPSDKTREITLTKMTQDSFQLSVQLHSAKVSVRDVVDIIANPDMLQFWCEPITELVVTEHTKGWGSRTNLNSHPQSGGDASTVSLSLSTLSSTFPMSSSPSSYSSFNDYANEQYIYPNVDDCDDDVIVPPAHSKCIKMERNISKSSVQQREESGEWIQASTPEIILPHLHTTFLDSCFKKVSTLLGFPNYGSLSMFIERNSAQVAFEMGPFRAGVMLSHKFKIEKAHGHCGFVILVDEVTIVHKDGDEDDGWILGSWFDPVRDMTKQWYTASLDGYILQAKASLRNLVDLVEGGGRGEIATSTHSYTSYRNKTFFSTSGGSIDQKSIPL
eukprot:CAMPEP_0203663010 /NCGR_PEP_ID=MMETSP0090-20130426/772_1 /ASSEMBLY_ACC=CAM_ASM_001088 /TAXON_ID=426623 /ORGANISM="Chaetoceros affinis, Strain CCMP159" /LENGTH=505 /DNA_ID=CAMNT_0050525869 /DNA_START=136 /DNA_END=1649 /DNA_ORIENTATION=-